MASFHFAKNIHKIGKFCGISSKKFWIHGKRVEEKFFKMDESMSRMLLIRKYWGKVSNLQQNHGLFQKIAEICEIFWEKSFKLRT